MLLVAYLVSLFSLLAVKSVLGLRRVYIELYAFVLRGSILYIIVFGLPTYVYYLLCLLLFIPMLTCAFLCFPVLHVLAYAYLCMLLLLVHTFA